MIYQTNLMTKGKQVVLVSSVNNPVTGINETFVFPYSLKKSKVASWGEIKALRPANHRKMIFLLRQEGWKLKTIFKK
jgi:hypothetical protein